MSFTKCKKDGFASVSDQENVADKYDNCICKKGYCEDKTIPVTTQKYKCKHDSDCSQTVPPPPPPNGICMDNKFRCLRRGCRRHHNLCLSPNNECHPCDEKITGSIIC